MSMIFNNLSKKKKYNKDSKIPMLYIFSNPYIVFKCDTWKVKLINIMVKILYKKFIFKNHNAISE